MVAILRTLALLWLLKQAFRLLRALLVAGVLVVLWPVTGTAAIAASAAWLLGWPPARLYRAAGRSLPVTGVRGPRRPRRRPVRAARRAGRRRAGHRRLARAGDTAGADQARPAGAAGRTGGHRRRRRAARPHPHPR